MKIRACVTVLLMLAVLAAGAAFVGCEMGSSAEPIDVTPSIVTLSATSNTVLLTANVASNSALLPLQWSVTDTSLGAIVQNSGSTVLYQATPALGVNRVIVRGADGTAGTVTITQILSQGGVLTVTPRDITLSGSNDTVVFTATISGNEALLLPLQWRESNSFLGSITRVSGLTAVYVRSSGALGNNTIVARAADGSEYAVIVRQQ